MIKNVSVDTKSTQEKEKNINEKKNEEYEEMLDRVRMFKFFQNLNKQIKEMEKEKEEYNSMEKIIREGKYSETKEKYVLGVRAKFDIHFEYFDISKHKDPDYDDECIYASRKFFFLKNIITDDEKKELEKFENNILDRFYYRQ